MNATLAQVRKETGEVLHTWRLYVIPGLLGFLGVTSPVIAALLPRLTRTMVERSPGVVFRMPQPHAADAYVQFAGNLAQMGILAVAITAAGLIVAEVRAGTAALALVKPLSRSSFVLVKAGVHALLTLAALVAGAAVCIGVTAAIFGPGPVARFAAAAGVWFVYALFMIAAAVLLSAVLRSQIAAAVSAVAVVIVLGLLGQLAAFRDYTPAGLVAAATDVLTGSGGAIVLPLVTGIVGTALLLAAAVAAFGRREL